MPIRDARLDDLPRIVRIYNSAIPGRQATADTAAITVEARLPWFHAHNPETRPILVLEDDGQVVAWLSLSTFYGRPAYHKTVEISVYVDPAHQGKRAGSRLIEEAIGRAPALGITTILAFIFNHNIPSLTLFTRHGFERWGLLPQVAELDGREADLAILGRKI